MQSKLDDSEKATYVCENCATMIVPPKYHDDPLVLIEDEGEYKWVSRIRRHREFSVEKCCDLPYIKDLE